MIFSIYNSLLPKQRFSLLLTIAIFQLLSTIIYLVYVVDTKNKYIETIGRKEGNCYCYDPYRNEWRHLHITTDRIPLEAGGIEEFLISKNYEVIRGGFLYLYFELIISYLAVSFVVFVLPIFVFYIIYVPM